MPLTKTNVELSFLNVVAGTPIYVDIPAFAIEEIYVKYGSLKQYAVAGTDFLVTLDQPDPAPPPTTQYYQFINVTPTAALLAKIALDGTNIIYVGRVLALTTDFSELDAFTRANIDVEFARTNMKLQQLEAAEVISALPDPRLGTIHDFIRVNADRSGYEFITAPGGGDMFRINNLSDVIDPVAALGNIGGQTHSSKLDGISALSATPGIMVHDGANTFAKRSIAAGTGITVTNPDGVGGNISIAVTGGTYQPANNNLTALGALDVAPGWLVQTGAAAFTKRTFTAGNGITISNPAGTGGDPSFAANLAYGHVWTADQSVSKNNAVFTVEGATGYAFLMLQATAGNIRGLSFKTGTGGGAVERWRLSATGGAESGGNAGSDLSLQAMNDAGAALFSAIAITRATGTVTFSGIINASTIQIGGTDILARANIWTADQNIQKNNAYIGCYGTSGYAFIGIQGVAGSIRAVAIKTGTSDKWRLGTNADTESGGNAGAPYIIQAFDDVGAPIINAIFIVRATGEVKFGQNINVAGVVQVANTQVLSTRKTGWTAATGTATRSTFVTGSVTLPVLAEHVKALIDDFISHGAIGA